MHNPCSRYKKKKTRAPVPDILLLLMMLYVCGPLNGMCHTLCLNRNGEMRALQCQSQFLLGEGKVVVRLDRVVGSTQLLIWWLAKVASVRVFCH